MLYFPTSTNNYNAGSSGKCDHAIGDSPANFPSFQFPCTGFIPVHASGVSPNLEDGWSPNLHMSISQLEAQKEIIQHQIEVLQNQLQQFQKSASKKSSILGSSSLDVGLNTASDSRGKEVSSSSSLSASGADGQHGMADKQDDAVFEPL